MSEAKSGPQGAYWRSLLFVLAADLGIKAILLVFDATPRLFLGDSRSYLYTALTGWIPPDRSFLYGFFLRIFAVWPHSLHTLVVCQAFLSGLSAWLVAVCLVRYFQISFAIATACSLLCAFEPLQLLAERYVLTEVVATLAFALFALLCFDYLATGRLGTLAVVQLSGALLIGLRIGFLPTAILCSFALPLFRVLLSPAAGSIFRQRAMGITELLRMMALPVLFGFILSQGLLFGYRHLYGNLIGPPMHGHPAYFYNEGLFLISDFAPLLKPIDYPIASQRARIFSPSRVPLAPPQNRDAQRWYPDGICDRIMRACGGDEQAADRIAHRTAVRALERDPMGAVRLSLQTAAQYFDRRYLLKTLRVDEGYEGLLPEADVASYRQQFGIDFAASSAHFSKFPSLTERWHHALYGWYWFLLLLPSLFAVCLLYFWRITLPAHWLCAVFLFLFFEGAILTVTRPTARFLTTESWLAFVALGSCYSFFDRQRFFRRF